MEQAKLREENERREKEERKEKELAEQKAEDERRQKEDERKQTEMAIANLYTNIKMSVQQIATIFSKTENEISEILKKNGI